MRRIRPAGVTVLFRKSLSFLRALIAAVYHAIDDRNLSLIAAGVAFFGLFAVFPGMAATIALWGYFSDPAVVLAYLDVAAEFIPAQAFSLLEGQLRALIAANDSALGWASILSLMVALYSAHAGVAALVQGLNAIHALPRRSGLSRLLVSVALTIALIGVVVTALLTVIVVPVALALVSLGPFEEWLISSLPWIVMFVMVLGTLAMLYRFAPSKTDGRDPWVGPGTLLAALMWAGASIAFSIYLANFNTYNRVYGSIGAVIALLMWFYISAYTVLFGAAVNAELSRLTHPEK